MTRFPRGRVLRQVRGAARAVAHGLLGVALVVLAVLAFAPVAHLPARQATAGQTGLSD